MRLLLDANLSPHIVPVLQEAGHEASHVVDHGLLEASDEKILQFALTQSAVIVSADSDFTTMLALAGLSAPSLVLLRSMDRLTPAQQASFLVSNLPAVEVELSLGAVVSISLATGIVMAQRNSDASTARSVLVGWSARTGFDLSTLSVGRILELLTGDQG